MGDPNKSQTATAYYAGMRYDPTENLGVGVEFNHGSPRWFTYTPATGEATDKLGTRGDVWEAYIHWRFAHNVLLRVGYLDYKYTTAFSGWQIAPAPMAGSWRARTTWTTTRCSSTPRPRASRTRTSPSKSASSTRGRARARPPFPQCPEDPMDRRLFLQMVGVGSIAATNIACPRFFGKAGPEPPLPSGVPTSCELCPNKCSVLAMVRRGASTSSS